MNEPQLYRLLEKGEVIEQTDVYPASCRLTTVNLWGVPYKGGIDGIILRPVPSPGWIPVSERMPTESDADTFRRVMWLDSNGSADTYVWNCNPKLLSPLIAWMPIPPYNPPKVDESRVEFEKAWAASDSEATWGKHGKEAAWWVWQVARASGNGKEGV